MKLALVILVVLVIAAVMLWLGPVDFAAGQSLEEIVRESEQSKGGESNQANGAGADVQQPSQRPDPTPPGGSDGGAAGRPLSEKRRLSAWAFGVWDGDGDLRSGGMFAERDECLNGRVIAKHRLPIFTVGPCTEIVHGKDRL